MNNLLSSGKRSTQDLRPHPLNDEIYGDRADSDLVESIKTKGVLNPLLITATNFIISGHRRWAAASAAGQSRQRCGQIGRRQSGRQQACRQRSQPGAISIACRWLYGLPHSRG